MEKDYDLFGRSQNHSLVWRGSVHGLENARRKLQQLARTTANECSVIYLPTPQVVALANMAHAKRVVFQVAYDEQKLTERADLLKLRGYEVVSVLGNERARAVLGLPQRVDLFIVGHNAPEPTSFASGFEVMKEALRIEMRHVLLRHGAPREAPPSIQEAAQNYVRGSGHCQDAVREANRSRAQAS